MGNYSAFNILKWASPEADDAYHQKEKKSADDGDGDDEGEEEEQQEGEADHHHKQQQNDCGGDAQFKAPSGFHPSSSWTPAAKWNTLTTQACILEWVDGQLIFKRIWPRRVQPTGIGILHCVGLNCMIELFTCVSDWNSGYGGAVHNGAGN